MASAPGTSVAVVEDDTSLQEALRVALTREGYLVTTFADGLEAWGAFQQHVPDLVVLDILLPRMDGLEVCRRLRAHAPAVPIIFLTSRVDELDRVLGLELGADDYLGKPFSLRELIARVRALLRRAALRGAPASAEERMLRVGALAIDLDRYTATFKGVPLQLTITELNLLLALARRPGHVKTRTQLLELAYPLDSFASERAIDTHIKRLRRKLVEADPEFAGIETVHGLGYRYRPG